MPQRNTFTRDHAHTHAAKKKKARLPEKSGLRHRHRTVDGRHGGGGWDSFLIMVERISHLVCRASGCNGS